MTTRAKRRSAAEYASAHWQELERLGLGGHVAELEANGLTVLPPGVVAAPGLAGRLREAVLRVAERRGWSVPDPEGTTDPAFAVGGFGSQLFYLLFEDPAFQEAVVNPAALALATHLLGESCILSNCLAGLKGPGGDELRLHSDNVGIPAPFPPYAQVCNVTWALTDYTAGSGQLHYVPGSHRLGRHPRPGEGLDELVPVEAEAGSIVFWHGGTWHGAAARERPGLRINLIVAMMRSYLRPQEMYKEHVTEELLARNPPRFATLVGRRVLHGWTEDGPDYATTYLPGTAHPFD